jgi:membrane protein YqaA with SNARE-associated domain
MKPRTEAIAQIVIGIGLVVVVWLVSDKIKALESWGYVGVFAISLVSAATIILPAPGWASVIAMSTVLNPYLVGIAAGLGSGLGEITGFLAGDGAAKIVVKNKKDYEKFKGWIRKYDMPAVFVLAAIPNPVFDVAGIAAGSAGIPITRFLVAVIAGRTVRYVLLAYIGAFSAGLV